MPMTPSPTLDLCGVRMHALTVRDLNAIAEAAVDSGRTTIIANHNLHSLALFRTDERMREFYKCADWIHIDGMAIVLLCRALGYPVGRQHRVAYLDWLEPLFVLA